VPWVMIMPLIDLSLRRLNVSVAIVFQSGNDMSSDAFMNGLIMIGLQIFFSSGAMFRISSLSVQVVPPVFGSNLADIVPPVIMIATRGSSLCFWFALLSVRFAFSSLRSSMILASRISFSLIPML